jgi:hypothetical protein
METHLLGVLGDLAYSEDYNMHLAGRVIRPQARSHPAPRMAE